MEKESIDFSNTLSKRKVYRKRTIGMSFEILSDVALTRREIRKIAFIIRNGVRLGCSENIISRDIIKTIQKTSKDVAVATVMSGNGKSWIVELESERY